MDTLEMARALFGNNAQTAQNGGQTTTTYGIAVSDSVDGIVQVNLGGDTASEDDDQTIEVETTFAVFEGDEVIVQLVGADGTGKAPCVIGVVGRGDEQQREINSVMNYFWTDQYGAHVSTKEHSVEDANVLLDSDSLDIRFGNSNDESDQTVYASFGREVTVGSRLNGAVGDYSQVFGYQCIATLDYAHAEGYQTQAKGVCSHAEGDSTQASGGYSHTEGQSTEATAYYAHAEGSLTVASSQGAHAEGHRTTASGTYSHAEGEDTASPGACSHAEGKGTYATMQNGHAQGKWNKKTTGYADIIGNGTADDARSNAYNMDWNGNAEFQGEVYVGGCTPNGETPYPVVRYNTGNSKQEYYDKVNSTWAQVPGGGGGGSWTSLWTNSAPSSDFSAQTVPLDLSGWNLIAILGKTSTSGTAYNITFIMPNGDTFIMTVGNATSTQYFYKRTVSADANGVTFSTGYRNTTGTSGASYCIPVAIYGLA